MCYKFLIALMLILVFLQYFYTNIGTGFVLPRLYFTSSDNLTSQHAPLFSAQDNDGASYTNDVKNLTAWLYHQKKENVGASDVSNFTAFLYQQVHEITTVNAAQPLPLCPLVPPNLIGVLGAYKEGGLLSDLENQIGKGLLPGGQWRPSHCKARDRVAIIIPYRDRTEHLSKFLANMHPFLQRQLLDYGIFVIEQYGNDVFNRAMLLNVGFVEALAIREFDCFIFHDVDLLPEDDRNLYTCPDQPRHMSAAVDVFNYRLPYADIFGGVSAMSKAQFEKVNGFSNKYWGWGGEDDDMAARIKSSGLHITRYPPSVARYTMLSHTKQKANPKRYETLYKGRRRMKKDGLNSLKYRKVASRLASLFTFETLYQGKKRMKVDGLNSLKYKKINARLTSLFTWVLAELNKV